MTLLGEPVFANAFKEQIQLPAEPSAKRRQRKSHPPRHSSRDGDDLPPPVHGRSAGSRGCMVEIPTNSVDLGQRDRLPALMLLAPRDSIAQTQSPQPLFAWYLRDSSPSPFIFRLYEVEGDLSLDNINDPQQTWTLLAEVILPSKIKHINARSQTHVTAEAGISVLELSSLTESPKLRTGGQYVWQIEMICDPERPSRNLFAQAALKMVVPSQQNRVQPNATEVAALLSQDLWQDALAMTLEKPGKLLNPSAQIILTSIVIDQGELEALQQATVHH